MTAALVLWVSGGLMTVAAFVVTPAKLRTASNSDPQFYSWLRARTLLGLFGLALLVAGTVVAALNS